jgi:hypothetical protein
VGVIVSISTFLTRVAAFSNAWNTLLGIPFVTGVVATVASIITAYWAIHPQAYAGIDLRNVSAIVENKPPKQEVLEGIVLGHSDLAQRNIEETRRSFRLLRASYVLLFINMALYSLAFLAAATSPGLGDVILTVATLIIVVLSIVMAGYPAYRWSKRFSE